MSKDRRNVFPGRYNKALRSLESNKNVMVVQSDKGRETVVCYRSTYSALLEEHFSNTDFYQTVGESDIVGQDLTSMTNNLTENLMPSYSIYFLIPGATDTL